VAEQPADAAVDDDASQLGQRLRGARERSGLSLRALARRLEISASALSQIETGKSRPSVRTLRAIVSELGLSMDQLFANSTGAESPGAEVPGGAPAAPIVQRADSASSIELDTGIAWDRLAAGLDASIDFFRATYQPGSSSSASERHSGREYGVVLSGELLLTVGLEQYLLGPGDSCSFDSNEPHRLANPGSEPAAAIWFRCKA
jgi:transcriptional regulator with XRE-family HTH domain